MNLSFILLVLLPYFYEMLRKLSELLILELITFLLWSGGLQLTPSTPTLLLRPLPSQVTPRDTSCCSPRTCPVGLTSSSSFWVYSLVLVKYNLLKFLRKNLWKITPSPFAYLKVFWSYSHITDSSVRFTILGWERIFHTVWKATDQSLLAPKRSRRMVQHNSYFQPFVCGCFPSWSLSVSSLHPCALKFHMTWSGWVLSRSLVCTWRKVG